ncbi:MAG: methylthioribulose 1-phosphate dehydratase [Proteobacteria bacterium]|nr:methylthioribulose 1-phosphate dehydratase [Pseudomonadota bacterium]
MHNDAMLEELVKTCDFISKKGLAPATAGNFSARLNDTSMVMSASGKDKSALSKYDFVVCDFQANLLSGDGKPSAEAALHGMIYQLNLATNCVLHTHSVPVTVLSMLEKQAQKITFYGYEMQKTIAGNPTHEAELDLPIFDNSQDIPKLALEVKARWDAVKKAQGFIVRGHGLYSFGPTVFDAKRHMEGLEFLVSCEFAKRGLISHD